MHLLLVNWNWQPAKQVHRTWLNQLRGKNENWITDEDRMGVGLTGKERRRFCFFTVAFPYWAFIYGSTYSHRSFLFDHSRVLIWEIVPFLTGWSCLYYCDLYVQEDLLHGNLEHRSASQNQGFPPVDIANLPPLPTCGESRFIDQTSTSAAKALSVMLSFSILDNMGAIWIVC